MKSLPLLCLALPLLTACLPAKPDLSTRPLVGCVANAEITKEDQQKAAGEVKQLAPDSVIANTIVPDWIRMRNANRVCAK